MAESGRTKVTAFNKPTNSLLQRIKQLEDELSSHINSYKIWSQKIEYTLVQTGIELMEPPKSARPDVSNSNSITLQSHREKEELEAPRVAVTDEDLDREIGPCFSEVSLDAVSEKSTEIGFNEAGASCSSLYSSRHASPLWQQCEDNSELSGKNNQGDNNSQSGVPTRPQVRIAASFKSSSKHSSSRSRHRRTKRSNSKPKTKGIPKKSSVVANRELIESSANTNSRRKEKNIKAFQIKRQEEREALNLLSVSGSGSSRLYYCNRCEFKAHHKPAAVTHARFTHGEGRIHPCTFCIFKFKNTWNVQNHMKLSHSGNSQSTSIVLASSSGRAVETSAKGTIVSSGIQNNANKSLEEKRVAQVHRSAKVRSLEDLNSEVDKAYYTDMFDNQEKEYVCSLCQYRSPQEVIIRRHILRRHKCPFCPLNEVDEEKLEDHIKCHNTCLKRRSAKCEKTQDTPVTKSRAIAYVSNSLESC